MARFRHYGHPGPIGVLGVYPSDPEVIGVYPELSSTILPHAQEVRMRRGDDLDLKFQVQNDYDPPDQVLIGEAIVRWAAKQGYGIGERAGLFIGNEGALLIKRSYEPREISIEGSGRGVVHVTRAESMKLPLSPAIWDLEVTMPKGEIEVPTTATVQLTAGTGIVTAINFTWPDTILAGDIFTTQGKRVLVISRVSPVHLKVDYSAWTTTTVPASAPGCADEFCLSQGSTKTIASGPFVVEGDVVI